MKLTCPSCGAVHSAEAWSNDANARQCMLIVAELPTEVSRRAIPYLALFRPTSGRGLSWTKALKLLKELKDLVADASIQWDRSPARANQIMAWADAMERVIQRPPRDLPLTKHNYLRKVAYQLADEIDQGDERNFNRRERAGAVLPAEDFSERSGGDLEPVLSVEDMQKIRKKNLPSYKKPSHRPNFT
ncbi:hypothetical protein DSCW_18340 [Desulfosarcina widdelii]|uniref:DUF2752 domain-containing protein n=1 Tax=Desulfosarcina widdelii TaxID=947919 RepID=A0A5K7ZDT5_9BACT|nr:hypothetical protein [Desulfosarcina widdelii]BBO74417.1 hypothetical protein DSCW_18340 [Desulfosarcina widdelii]